MAEEAPDPVYDLSMYLWIAILSTFTGFIYAFGIGANDVANAFASTVASKSLTLKQAIIVASIFEFCGAFFLGASVTNTIRGKIIDIDLYADQPEVLMLGMFTALITGTIMLLVATAFALPVSTTHTIVGSIMGFSIVAEGFSSVNWDEAKKIFISWVASPLVSGFLSFLFFSAIRYFVMRNENCFERAVHTFPIVLIVGIGIDLFYILYKATSNFPAAKDMPLYISLPVAFGTGLVCALIWSFLVGPIIVKRIEHRAEAGTLTVTTGVGGMYTDLPKKVEKTVEKESPDYSEEDTPEEDEDEREYNPDDPESWDKPPTRSVSKKVKKVEDVEVADVVKPETSPDPEVEEEENMDVPKRGGLTSSLHKFGNQLAENTYRQDLKTQSLHENAGAAKIWAEAEHFDPKAEELFTYIQVFTACLNSFAHGANDVANAIGPIASVLSIYQTGTVESKSTVPKWILAYGGVGIVAGLLIFGYRVMKSIGYKLTALSPSRGACAELAASLFVVTASFLGIPVSSTQSIVGAVAGVGLTSGAKNVQWFFFLRVMVGWAAIFLSACIGSAAVFAFIAFSPSIAPPVEQIN